jgi:hypothetical protein
MSLEAFLSLSFHLTGFPRVELVATGMLEEYYQLLLATAEDEKLRRLWAIAAQVDKLAAANNHAAFSAEIQHALTDEHLGPIAKNIIRLWYTGTWRKDPSDALSSKVASAQSYQQGLVWKAAHSHPPGAKQPGFGSWSELPR